LHSSSSSEDNRHKRSTRVQFPYCAQTKCMAEAGRPTDLTDELFAEIKKSIMDGNDLRETARVCKISESTLYHWHCDNYANITDKIEGWKRDRKLLLADKNIDGILCLGISDKDSLKVVADMSKFVKETLDKENYSKRTENTGKDGAPLFNSITPEDIALAKKLSEMEDDNSRTNKQSEGGFTELMDKEV